MSSNLIVNNIEVGAGATIYTAASNTLTFGTNGSEKVRISSGGEVGIGINNPEAYEANGNNLVVGNTTGHNGITILTGTDKDGRLGFADGTGAASYRGMIEYQHGTGANEFMKIAVAGDERLRITSGGKLIVGGASSADSSALINIIKNTTEVLADNEPLYNNASPAFLTVYNSNNTGSGEEAGINIVPAGNANGAISIYGKKTGSYAGDLIFRFRSGASTSAERLRIDSSGRLLLGAGAVSLPKGSGAGSFDLDNGSITMCVGGNVNSTGRTNSTDKINRITSPHYTNAEEPVALISSYNVSGSNTIQYGGGSSLTNAVTQHAFYTAANTTTTNGTERLRINSTGHVTIGEADFTASNDVHIKRANAGGDVAIRITNNTNQNSGSTASLYFTTSPTQDFNTAYIKAVRDGGKLNFGYATNSPTVTMQVSTNRVGIASAIPVCSLDVIGGGARFGTANTSKNVDGCIIERNSGDGLVHIAACRTGGNYSGLNFYVSGDVGGSGANAKLRHLIDYQGYFRWYASDGTTERLRINNTGVVQVMSERLTLGTSITNGGANDGNLCVEFSSASRNAVKLRDTHNTGSTTYMVLVGGSATVGSITGTTGQASYNNLSDYRSKENDVKITDGIAKLKLLRPIRFNYKTDSSTLCDGFFAHEVTPAVPTAVTGEKDAVDSEGKIDAQMLDTSKMVPLLTAALQEAIAKIETLETKVAALEGS